MALKNNNGALLDLARGAPERLCHVNSGNLEVIIYAQVKTG